FANPQTIALTLGEVAITRPVTITGTGNGRLTLYNARPNATQSRILNIGSATPTTGSFAVAVSDLALVGGNASAAGGAVAVASQAVTFTNVVFAANQTTATGGGAVAVGNSTTPMGRLTLVNCALT